jgi:hypothetical protein
MWPRAAVFSKRSAYRSKFSAVFNRASQMAGYRPDRQIPIPTGKLAQLTRNLHGALSWQ